MLVEVVVALALLEDLQQAVQFHPAALASNGLMEIIMLVVVEQAQKTERPQVTAALVAAVEAVMPMWQALLALLTLVVAVVVADTQPINNLVPVDLVS
jgi:hypothetical protein